MSTIEILPIQLIARPKSEAVSPQELAEKAQDVLDRYGSPYESPDFQRRRVPGIWGVRTTPLPFINRDCELMGSVYLAQQFPTMAMLIVAESPTGERGVLHNLDPQLFSANQRVLAHLNLQGDLYAQRPALATHILNHMEQIYSQLGEP
jgi:hypothetical protein